MRTAAISPKPDFLSQPRNRVALLIGVTLLARALFALSTGLGVDESYTVATGRQLALSAYDHPPLAWWLSWLGVKVFGIETGLSVRLPFILLFAATTWQFYRLGELLFDAETGWRAALILNCAPVLGITTGTWVLPDGPLLLGLVSGAVCIGRVLFNQPERPAFWLAAGFWGGIAMLSKYHGVFLFAGVGLFLLTTQHRRWLATPWPYGGAAIALLMFTPVVVWNYQHHWVSFLFQGGRAAAISFRLWMPFAVLAGHALFLLPWLWLALVLAAARACRISVHDERRWLLFCLGIGPVALFTAVAAWSQGVLLHWAMPRYLMWIPLAAADLAQTAPWTRHVWRHALAFSACVTALVAIDVATLANLPVDWAKWRLRDPLKEIHDLTEINQILADKGYAPNAGTFVGAVRWLDAGKIDYAMKGRFKVTCLCDDARGYSILAPMQDFAAKDGLVLVPPWMADHVQTYISARFQSLERLEDITIHHAGQPLAVFMLYYGTKFQPQRGVTFQTPPAR